MLMSSLHLLQKPWNGSIEVTIGQAENQLREAEHELKVNQIFTLSLGKA